jgi:hypothetical protein
MKTLNVSRRSACATLGASLAGLFAWPVLAKEEKKKESPPPPQPQPQVVAACGPLCALILVLIILGVATYMVVKLIQWCKKLNKKQSKPDDPNSGAVPPGPAFVTRALTSSGGQTMAFDMGDAYPPSWDISDWAAAEGTDGIPNSPFHDGDGNPYCVEFHLQVHAADSPMGPWAPMYCVVGYVSFMSTDALQWAGPDNGGHYPPPGQYPPQNIRMKWFKNSVAPANLVAITYDRATEQQGVTVPQALLGNSPAKFFRLVYPQNE